MNRSYAPLFETLIRLAKQDPVSFHVPGHRYGHTWEHHNSAESEAYSAIMKLDTTELSATDDLHHPEAAIAEAQILAAKRFGAEETFFLVGGSTSGNLALILAVCEPGDLVIVQRNVHKSVINGLRLAGARAVFVMPQTDDKTSLAVTPSLADVKTALDKNPEAKAVFLTNPNYYGMSVNLEPYAALIHAHDKLLLVDEAHGAHYGFHPALPRSAIFSGADAVVQSTHKTLTALTMGAMLHIQGERIPRYEVRQALAIVQSSSPSFPIMASIDISRAMIDRYGTDWFQEGIDSAAAFREWIAHRATALRAIQLSDSDNSNAYNQLDPLRVVIWDATGAYSGYELQKLLEEQGCWAEMADPRHVVLVFHIKTSLADVEKLIASCLHIEMIIASTDRVIANTEDRTLLQQPAASDEPVLFYRRRNARTVRVSLSEAVDTQSAEMVIPYPPGIPIVYPGEHLTMEIIQYIAYLSLQGAKFQGASDPAMKTIEVYVS